MQTYKYISVSHHKHILDVLVIYSNKLENESIKEQYLFSCGYSHLKCLGGMHVDGFFIVVLSHDMEPLVHSYGEVRHVAFLCSEQ